MTEEDDSKECLRLAIEHLKALHATLAAVMTDQAALRKVVSDDAKDSERYQLALAEEMRKAKPLVANAMEAYDDLIVRVMSSGTLRH
jgi:hypothetical protein